MKKTLYLMANGCLGSVFRNLSCSDVQSETGIAAGHWMTVVAGEEGGGTCGDDLRDLCGGGGRGDGKSLAFEEESDWTLVAVGALGAWHLRMMMKLMSGSGYFHEMKTLYHDHPEKCLLPLPPLLSACSTEMKLQRS